MHKHSFNYSLKITFVLIFSACTVHNNNDQQRLEVKHDKSLQTKIGDTFIIGNIVDSSGRLVQLDFSKNDLTVVDFWFNDCPPCIEEMKQFENVLKGKEDKINIISISINSFSVWKSILQNPKDRFAFLSNNVSNWKHYDLQSADEKLNNPIPKDNQKQVEDKLNVRFFPAYFVVGSAGVILSRPKSAVDYIKTL